ncbi:MAG: desulfoferrodoxin [candidate division Zixibacteria bacterium]|nr:desulfoferrodoxin [candidate division Zixibacteria bacterium]
MTERSQVYKCEVCGNMTEVVHTGGGTLVCCGQNMHLVVEGEVDAATEKHVPVIKKIDGGYVVKVGEVSHPMGDDHYIEWIELIADGKVYRQFLNPSDTPEATFKINADNVSARAYCNLHGLWKV